MNYEEALARLHSLYNFGIWEGLERIQALLLRLGSPERAIPRYLHIAGTNGKGSVSAMLDAVSRVAGLRTGLFTSPHLHDHRERYRIDGKMIAPADFARVFSRVIGEIDAMTAAGEDSPTEFEAATALALTWFAEQQVDLVVLEVGLGGNADSTNVIIPQVSVVTNVGLDHLTHLGNTVEEIARKKAGILKPHVPAVTGAEGGALAVIEAKARACAAPLTVLGRDLTVSVEALTAHGSTLTVTTPQHSYQRLFLPLLGQYQARNAALAVAAAELAGFDEDAIRQGLSQVFWPGRLETLSEKPLVVIDGAHNAPGMAALAEAVAAYWPGKKILAVLGMLADKQREEALPPLLPYLSRVIVTPPDNPTRIGDWQRLADICRACGVAAACQPERELACAQALALLKQGEYDMLLVAGSLYLLADLRLILLSMIYPPEEAGKDGYAAKFNRW